MIAVVIVHSFRLLLLVGLLKEAALRRLTNKHLSVVRVAVIPDDVETLVAHGGQMCVGLIRSRYNAE
jgi:hypothetical protein